MKELRGNLHHIPCDVVCITTNGYASSTGKAVMGRGCAKEIKDMHPGIDYILGTKLLEEGNTVQILKQGMDGKYILSFPVKTDKVIFDGDNIVAHAKSKFKKGDTVPGYYAKADLDIIEESAKRLVRLADTMPEWKTILVPRPGCGAGELDWSAVKPILKKYFDDRFTVVSFPRRHDTLYYAGIGARATPDDVLDKMTELATWLEGRGLVLRTGGAEGADTAFEVGCTEHELYLPWPRYEGKWSENSTPSEEAKELASQVHWNWDNCSPAVKKLHGRNAEILLDRSLDHPVKFVVCWTEDGKEKGGTGIGIRIARQANIPIFNLGLGADKCIVEIKDYVMNNLLETKVVNLYKEPFDIYIGRPKKGETSIWGNPFIVGVDGEQGECVGLYDDWVRKQIENKEISLFELGKLRGRRLGCFCKPKACHGDVLVNLVNEYFPKG